MDAIPKIHGTDSEDRFPELRDGAIMNPIHTRPADDLGKYGRAEIPALLLSPLKTNMRKIQFGSDVAVQNVHDVPPLCALRLLWYIIAFFDIRYNSVFEDL